MTYVFPPPLITSLALLTQRGDLIGSVPVRRVYCVGRNYAAHAVEMGHDPDRESPFFFQKNPDNLVPNGGDVPYPPQTGDLHHEIELVFVLKQGGRNIPVEEAFACVCGYGVGLDLTRRDLQSSAKKAGRPWEIAKAFEKSAPVTDLITSEGDFNPDAGKIWLTVNGEERQSGDLAQMIWKVPEIISILSHSFDLAAGDMVMTGTPAGVGPLMRGDVVKGGVAGLPELSVKII